MSISALMDIIACDGGTCVIEYNSGGSGYTDRGAEAAASVMVR